MSHETNGSDGFKRFCKVAFCSEGFNYFFKVALLALLLAAVVAYCQRGQNGRYLPFAEGENHGILDSRTGLMYVDYGGDWGVKDPIGIATRKRP